MVLSETLVGAPWTSTCKFIQLLACDAVHFSVLHTFHLHRSHRAANTTTPAASLLRRQLPTISQSLHTQNACQHKIRFSMLQMRQLRGWQQPQHQAPCPVPLLHSPRPPPPPLLPVMPPAQARGSPSAAAAPRCPPALTAAGHMSAERSWTGCMSVLQVPPQPGLGPAASAHRHPAGVAMPT